MPKIYDNIEDDSRLLTGLHKTLEKAFRADICVGYFRLRGWHLLAEQVEKFSGAPESCCRILIGMVQSPEDEMRASQRAIVQAEEWDGPERARHRHQLAASFKEQLEAGIPTKEAQTTLQQLARQLRAGKVHIKLYLAHQLHAKLYLFERDDADAPYVGYLGSSNLTPSGLRFQGELNINVLEQDAADKLQTWFKERWKNPEAVDISLELAEMIENSWARASLVSPYHVYLKIAYYLCEEARRGEKEFRLPKAFQGTLLDFQAAAVSLAAHYLHRRGGVLLGDVVGLGKTLMATAVAKIFQEDDNSDVLVICPPKLQSMWQGYLKRYQLSGQVVSLGKVTQELPDLMFHRLVIIDESHNLRNRESKRYKAVHEYIEKWDPQPRILLLTATPYNKQFTDLSNQLRLLVGEDQDLRVRPERYFQSRQAEGYTERRFTADFNASPRSLRAFEQSEFAEDWRDLMRLFLVRRTRQFILRNYAHYDSERQRYYVTIQGKPAYFPIRQPATLKFKLDDADPSDQYARLFREQIVQTIENLHLPRYGLLPYLASGARQNATAKDRTILQNLNRAGRRLIGFSRTNLFKRLESDGHSFLLSLDRHILRNLIAVHALENSLDLPLGTQDPALLDTLVSDNVDNDFDEEGIAVALEEGEVQSAAADLDSYRQRAAQVYQRYATQYQSRFKWLGARFFKPTLREHLLEDVQALLGILRQAGVWQPGRDEKLKALMNLLTETHPTEKVLVFSQFADTARYLGEQLVLQAVPGVAVATADSDAVELVQRFSPRSNGLDPAKVSELRILIATDVLAEGQNLQDAHVIVNFDLPWAIIRLIQRSGRVDRIGQQHETIRVYSFLPADGVEAIIKLRSRLSQRLEQNQEVIGSDEAFFGEDAANRLRDLYTEQSGVLDRDDDEDVDLSSIALQVWNSAAEADRKAAIKLTPGSAAARQSRPTIGVDPIPGAIAYLRFPDGGDALVQVNPQGQAVSQNLTTVFRNAACGPDAPALPLAEGHHTLVASAVRLAAQEQKDMGGNLGSLRSTRRKVYERLKRYRELLPKQEPLFAVQKLATLDPAYNEIIRFPLTEAASQLLARQIRLGVTDENLAQRVAELFAEGRLCVPQAIEQADPLLICSLGVLANE